jgi:hypothetical protein
MFKWIKIAGKHIAAAVGGKSYTIESSHPEFEKIYEAAKSGNVDEFVHLADVPVAMNEYTQGSIRITGGQVYFGNHRIENSLTRRIIECMNRGIPFSPFVAFLNNLVQNPSKRALNELYSWLEHQDIPITTDGHWLGYKAVNSDWKDKRTGTVDNHVGQTPTMPRSMVNDNWGVACSEGFHVGSTGYVNSFGGGDDKFIIVKVNPKDVVSVPSGDTHKCRVDRYTVIAEWEPRDPLKWPVYDAPGPEKPIRPVAGIFRDGVKPHMEPGTPESDSEPNDIEEDAEQEETDYDYKVRVTLKLKATEGMLKELEEEAPGNIYQDGDIEDKGSYDIVTFAGFDDESEADGFVDDVMGLSYVLAAETVKVDDDGDEVDDNDEDEEPKDPNALDHLTTRQRFELRQRAIEVLMGSDPNRHHAEMKIEGMTRLQMADLLPDDEKAKYIDPDYEPETKDFYPISFDIFDGGIKVSSHSVRTTEEEEQILTVARQIYGMVEQHNRVDGRNN